MTLLEVQAYGIPCIVSNCCAAVDNIQEEITGFLFELHPIKKSDIANKNI